MSNISTQRVERAELIGVLSILMDQGVSQWSVTFDWRNGTYTVSWPNPRKKTDGEVNQEDEE